MNVKIRHVEKEDLEGCYNVENRCYTDEGASKERIEKRIDLYPQGFLIAELDGNIIGIINGTSTNRDDIGDEELKDMVDFDVNGKNAVIFSVAVLPEHQGKGIAKLLLNKLIDNCKKMGTEKIMLICKEHLIKMYEKFGFALIGKSESKHGGFNWFEMVLQLK
ncbi:GNAT family N-acetyltransferase [Candidatus Woesearchaeota archaeon]|nr:GNAT family N-acetyltransferase [Candidatus Woesearchaeota archaeon]